jgi:hypothetical protein
MHRKFSGTFLTGQNCWVPQIFFLLKMQAGQLIFTEGVWVIPEFPHSFECVWYSVDDFSRTGAKTFALCRTVFVGGVPNAERGNQINFIKDLTKTAIQEEPEDIDVRLTRKSAYAFVTFSTWESAKAFVANIGKAYCTPLPARMSMERYCEVPKRFFGSTVLLELSFAIGDNMPNNENHAASILDDLLFNYFCVAEHVHSRNVTEYHQNKFIGARIVFNTPSSASDFLNASFGNSFISFRFKGKSYLAKAIFARKQVPFSNF